MFSKRLLFVLICGLVAGNLVKGQRIVYSEPDRDDNRRMTFEVVGKISGNFLVYKNIRNKNWITVFDNDMKPITKVEQDYIPSDRLINIDFFPYNDFFYAIYQYQRKGVVYCDAVKLDGNCKKLSDVIQLDTTHIGFAANNKIYSVISSEDKSYLILDNARIHYTTKKLRELGLSIEELAVQKNIILLYLPPHSPELNPTEKCFNNIRHNIEKSRPRTHEELKLVIDKEMASLQQQELDKYFRNCFDYFIKIN